MSATEAIIEVCRDANPVGALILVLMLFSAVLLPFAAAAMAYRVVREMLIENCAIQRYAANHGISRSSVGICRRMALGGYADFEVFDKANYWGSREDECYGKGASETE